MKTDAATLKRVYAMSLAGVYPQRYSRRTTIADFNRKQRAEGVAKSARNSLGHGAAEAGGS